MLIIYLNLFRAHATERRIFVSLRSGNNRSAHAQIVQFCAALVTSASPGIRVHLWVALSVDVRCSDTVAGRKRDGASKRSRRGAPYCQRRPILTPGALESV